ncbi:MAG: hypothetical protein OHK0013_09200 [Sandaracinaceae bacterium]
MHGAERNFDADSMQRCREPEMQRTRDAENQRCREPEMQRGWSPEVLDAERPAMRGLGSARAGLHGALRIVINAR